MHPKPKDVAAIEVNMAPQEVVNLLVQAISINGGKMEESRAEDGYAFVSYKHKLGGVTYLVVSCSPTATGSRIEVGPLCWFPFKGYTDPANLARNKKGSPDKQLRKGLTFGEQLIRNTLAYAGQDVAAVKMTQALEEQKAQTNKLQKEVKKARRDAGCLGCLWLSSCFVVAIGASIYAFLF